MPSSGVFGYLEEDGCDEIATHKILEGQELLIGRDHKTCNIILTDPTVSNQHLQIYTISYNEDNHQRMFVYAKDLSTNGSYWRHKHDNRWREYLIGKGSAVLLSDGDKLRLCNGSSFIFRFVSQNSESSQDASTVQEDDIKLFSNLFKVTDRKLGSGAYGEVRMAIDVAHERQMACKMVKLGKSPHQRLGRVRYSEPVWREVELLKNIRHPNIIYVERIFYSEQNLFIISDLIAGGDLMSYIEQPWTNMDDAEACIIIYQLLKALEYLHRQGICHRDLKPENILMSTPARGARVILTDFGHSTKLSGGKQARNRRMKTASVGTDYYVAPEIRGKNKNTKGYTMATDMWSIGIITTLLLTGEFVFENSKDNYALSAAILDAAAECNLAKMDHDPAWQAVNNLGKEFVKGLLVLDENARPDAGQALKHGWFADGKRKKPIQQEYEEAIRGWMPRGTLLDFKEDLALWKEACEPPLDSILMPPPAKPSSSGSLQRPLQDGHQSSPYFPRDLQASKKRDLECGNEVITPSIVPEQAVPAKKRRNLDTHEKSYGQSESKKPAKSSAKQVGVGEHKTLFQIESFQRIRRPSTDLDHEECKLHDRVSREEASIFRSAKIYGQSVEKRRRLGN